jgi:predicted nucleic acid-binding protein
LQATLVFVSDTNIWIDFEKVGLLDKLFSLPFQYCTTDFVANELEQPDARKLVKRGLQVKSLEAAALMRIEALMQRYARPSFTDLSCLVMAEEIGCKLLTGDQALRKAAEKESNVVVHGVLWLLDQMIEHKILSKKKARAPSADGGFWRPSSTSRLR